MIEKEEVSGFEKSKLPYSLLLDPETGRAAAYTNTHRLITPLASSELVAFAQANIAKQAAWDDGLHDPLGQWRPLPEWATDEVRWRCVLIWIRRGRETAEYWESFPSK